MGEGRINVGPEAVFTRPGGFPESFRSLFGKFDRHNRLDALKTEFPRHNEPQGGAVLPGQRMTVDAGDQQGEVVHRLFDGQRFDIRLGIPDLQLAEGNRSIQEGGELDVVGVVFRRYFLDQGREGKTSPRYGHGPGLDAPKAIEAFL